MLISPRRAPARRTRPSSMRRSCAGSHARPRTGRKPKDRCGQRRRRPSISPPVPNSSMRNSISTAPCMPRDDYPADLTLRFNHFDLDSIIREYLNGRIIGHSGVTGLVQLHGPLRKPREMTVVGESRWCRRNRRRVALRTKAPSGSRWLRKWSVSSNSISLARTQTSPLTAPPLWRGQRSRPRRRRPPEPATDSDPEFQFHVLRPGRPFLGGNRTDGRSPAAGESQRQPRHRSPMPICPAA